jgi:hypothetical protein
MPMEWARNTTANREFERFAAEVSDPLLRTGLPPLPGRPMFRASIGFMLVRGEVK